MLQAPGRHFAPRDVQYAADDAAAELQLDLATAYPETAGVSSWRRTVRLDRGEAVTVTDDYALAGTPPPTSASIVTPYKVELGGAGVIGSRERPIGAGRVSGRGRGS